MNNMQNKGNTVIEVFVKPHSVKFGITVENGEIVIRCTEEPEKGKVNREIIKALSKTFHTDVELISGATSRQKRLLIKNVEKSEVEDTLQKLGDKS